MLILSVKVIKGAYEPLPSNVYSPGLRSVVDIMLMKKVKKRPTVNELLLHPSVASKVQEYLDELSTPGTKAHGWSTWRMKLPAQIIGQVGVQEAPL